jgi:hypothetical protein
MKLVDLDKLLPADIPEGERVLWHGRPEWVSLARHAWRVDFVAAYFGALVIWNAAMEGAEAGSAPALVAVAKTLALAAAGLGLLCLLAWLSARTTLYVVTSRRIVMKVGVALPIFFNLPFSQIDAAALRTFKDGTGDIPLALAAGRRIAYLHLWPHARPFHIANPQPALRSVPQAAAVAITLRDAMTAEAQTRLGSSSATTQSTNVTEAPQGRFPTGAVAA